MLLVTSFGSSETQPEVCEYNTQLDKLIIPFYNLFAAECYRGLDYKDGQYLKEN